MSSPNATPILSLHNLEISINVRYCIFVKITFSGGNLFFSLRLTEMSQSCYCIYEINNKVRGNQLIYRKCIHAFIHSYIKCNIHHTRNDIHVNMKFEIYITLPVDASWILRTLHLNVCSNFIGLYFSLTVRTANCTFQSIK